MNSIEYAYARWARKRLPLPTEQQVAELESRLGVELPEDYRQYLLEFNGGVFNNPVISSPDESCPRQGLFVLYGVESKLDGTRLGEPWQIALFDDNDPLIALPIGDTAFGDLIILSTAPENFGAIFFKQASGGWFELAEGIEEFFANLREPDWG